MNDHFDLVCFFGYSPHLRLLARFCEDLAINYCLIFGPRQSDAINLLDLPLTAHKLCVRNLGDSEYQKLRVRNSKSIGFSFGSPFIFKQEDIDDFKGMLINSHGAPLPEFKGGGGFSWRILQHDKRGVILMHYVTTRIDEGGCVFRKDFNFLDDERTPHDHEERQLREETYYLIPWVKEVISGQTNVTELPSTNELESHTHSYFPRLCTDLHGYIDWSLAAQDLETFVLAFSIPYQGAATFLKGEKVRIMDCCVNDSRPMHPFTLGLVLHKDSEEIIVACNGGTISIKHGDLKFGGSSCTVNIGDRFFTPSATLEKSLSTRVFYMPDRIALRDYKPNDLGE